MFFSMPKSAIWRGLLPLLPVRAMILIEASKIVCPGNLTAELLFFEAIEFLL